MNYSNQKQLFKGLVEESNSLNHEYVTNLTNLVCAYMVSVGGEVEEENFLNISEAVGIDLTNERQFNVYCDLMSVYSGGGLIKIRDDGLGIAKIINNPNSSYYKMGEKTDFSAFFSLMKDFMKNLEQEKS